MPFPMPRSVICSPSHMTNTEPVVSVSTVMIRNDQPGSWTMAKPPCTLPVFSRKNAMPSAWTTLRRIVP